jgi:hypothetical protein
MSMDKISNAVPASSPLANTVFEMASGFSSTAAWLTAEPMVDTMPSPTRRKDGFLTRTTHQAIDVRPHRHPCDGDQLNSHPWPWRPPAGC